MAAPAPTFANILHILDPPTLNNIVSMLAVSPCAQANQLGNTNRLWFFKWHFHKKAVYFPMICSGLDSLARSRDDAGLNAMHILVDALGEVADHPARRPGARHYASSPTTLRLRQEAEEQSEHPARRHLRLRHTN